MKLVYSKETKRNIEIVNRLKELSLAYKIVLSVEAIVPALIEGITEYCGIDKWNLYKDQLDSEKEQWYYCNVKT